MNTIRNFKYRNTNNVVISGASPSTAKPNTSGGKGVFNKLSKRYANVKLLRTSPGRQVNGQPVSTGSYDMRGGSEELKREIGAPILISKTCIDMDTTDCQPSEAWRPAGPLSDRTLSTVDITKRMTIYDEGAPRNQSPNKSLAPLKQARSKSATNLHRSEIKVFLHRAPSLKMDHTGDQVDSTSTSVHKSNEHSGTPKPISLQKSRSKETLNRRLSSTSDTYSSKDSLNLSNIRNETSEHSFSHDSLTGHENSPERLIDEFQTTSYHSLDARNLFQSIEELNEITRKINESDEFNQHIDLEYCEHRDNLRPDQRRITLLRTKNSGVLGLDQKREKLGYAWKGLKHWIEEKEEKVKEVVQKHAALQRVGGVIYEDVPIGTMHSRKPDIDNFNQCYVRETSYDEQDAVKKLHDAKSWKGSTTFRYDETREGQNGFEELRRYVKQGSDFGKELVNILQERSESEQIYSKSLSKMAMKLNKASREIPGSLAEGWRGVAAEMESRSEVHRIFSISMTEEVVKPLKVLLENQHKTRKSVEAAVEKSSRLLSEWRSTEAKAKKASHAAARENEKLQDAMLDVRIQRSPSIAMLHNQVNQKSPERDTRNTEKDCVKLDNKRRKAEEAVKRADVEYYTLCIRAERARVEWEMAVLKGSTILYSQENQRLATLQTNLADYLKFSQLMSPSHIEMCEQLQPLVATCNVLKDMNVIKNIRRASEGPSEQLLPDFYCEHTTLAMNRERRKHALVKLLQLVRTDLERERKSRSGLQVVSKSLNTPENQNVTDKLYHIRAMLTYLEGARYKLQSALLELDHKPRGAHPLAPHVQITRDRTGLQQSILKVPLWLGSGDEMDGLNENYYQADINANNDDTTNELLVGAQQYADSQSENLIKHFDRNFNRSQSHLGCPSPSTSCILTRECKENQSPDIVVIKHIDRRSKSPAFDRGIADGGSNQPDSDFDEFSSQDEEDELGNKNRQSTSNSNRQSAITPAVISRCRAIYNYKPKLSDELELNPGDILDVYGKQEDGWWLGGFKTKSGIFPATYVEEIA